MRRAAAGFTLLELVLAMTGVALIAAICYGAFHVGIRAVERGEMAVVTAQRLRILGDVFVRQIKSAANYTAYDPEEGMEYPYFVGEPRRMSFVTAAGQLSGGGLVRVTYRFEEEPVRQLLLDEEPLFTHRSLTETEDEQPMRHTAVLLEHFESATFLYAGLDPGEEGNAAVTWCATWDPTLLLGDDDCDAEMEEVLPRAVRIVLTGVPGVEGGVWGQDIPLMVVTFGEDNGGTF
jgi:general secretion pathway protein J